MTDVKATATGRRQRQALETRRKIRAAAQDLFERQGYASTTINQIAERADVAWQTVYAVFKNKAAILSEIFDVTVAGDDKPIPMGERQFVRDIANTDDRREKARIFAAHLREANARTAAVQSVIESAASTDADMATLWDSMMRQLTEGMSAAARAFDAQDALRGVTVQRAADLLWFYAGPWTYRGLVVTKGWTAAAYEAWLTETLFTQLMSDVR